MTIELKAYTLKEIKALFASKQPLCLSAQVIKAVEDSRAFLDSEIQKGGMFYGVNTGFGALYTQKIDDSDLEKLQENLLLSHAAGQGSETPKEVVKWMLLTKIIALSKGYSGVRVELLERLLFFYNQAILPVVYDQGSLGASGDLAPLAHLALPLIGRGDVWVDDVKLSAQEMHHRFKIEPLPLKSKEGLALINGTQFMLAHGVFALFQIENLFDKALEIAGLSLLSFEGTLASFDQDLMAIRRQKGQIYVAKKIRENLKGFYDSKKAKHLQDPYSFRCIPQVLGAVYDQIGFAKTSIEHELNAVTDNPTIFAKEKKIISGGNFHGEPLALTFDSLAIALCEMASISERRVFKLLSGSRGLPLFLTPKPGIHSGLMIAQYTAASMVSQNKQLATPSSVDTIDSSNGQEDHVSMGANGATKLLKILENVRSVLAIEYLCAAQGFCFRGDENKTLIKTFLDKIGFIKQDTELRKLIEKAKKILTDGIS